MFRATNSPIFRGQSAEYLHRWLGGICGVTLFISLGLALFFGLLGVYPLVGSSLFIASTQLIALFALYWQRPQLALWMIPVSLFCGSAISALYLGDVHWLFVGYLGLAIISGGALLGKRAAWATAVASILFTTTIILYLPPPIYNIPTPINIFWLLALLQLIIIAIITHLIIINTSNNYHRLEQSNAHLQTISHTLEARTQELLRINEALRHSEAVKETILNSIPDMMAVISPDGTYRDYRALSYFREEDPPASVIGKTVHQLLSPQMATRRLALMAKVLASQKIYEYEEVQVARGEAHYFATRLVPMNSGDVFLMMRDITAEKQREQTQLANQKLESVSLLAGGIAHDFNNLLTGMMSQSSLALHKLPDDHPAANHIHKANRAANRAADLTRQLLAYTGQGQFQIEGIDLNQLISENVAILGATFEQPVQIHPQLAPALPLFWGDRGQIQQVVMNLIINAAEACQHKSEGGWIQIRTQKLSYTAVSRHLQEQLAKPATADSLIALVVADNGIGMDAPTQKRIFEPFYSNKAHGRGLGLAALWGVVRAYQGTIDVQSTLGQGTTFTILLPLPQDKDS